VVEEEEEVVEEEVEEAAVVDAVIAEEVEEAEVVEEVVEAEENMLNGSSANASNRSFNSSSLEEEPEGVAEEDEEKEVQSHTAESFLQTSASAASRAGPHSSANGLTFSGNHPMQSFACKKGVKKRVSLTQLPEQLHTESDMADYVCKTGVMSIAVDASRWSTYVSGVMTPDSCSTSIDHAVTLVGINEEHNTWIVQNQWGPDWGVALDGAPPPKDQYGNCPELAKDPGCSDSANPWIKTDCALSCSESVAEGGYIFLEFGTNTCGITTEALAPTSTVTA
jgi:hypothetical protein